MPNLPSDLTGWRKGLRPPPLGRRRPIRRQAPALVLLLAGCWPIAAVAQSSLHRGELGVFEMHTDIGTVKTPGAVTYDEASQVYTVRGSGANVWGGHDELSFVFRRMKGDFVLTADADLVGDAGDPHRKLGWTIRADLEPDSAHVDLALHGDGLTALQFRRAKGAPETEEIRSTVSAPDVLRLERRGDRYLFSVARRGDRLSGEESVALQMPEEVLVGLFVCAHDADAVETGKFSNVRVTVPAPADFRPYADYIGSRLETVEVETGLRRVVHTESDSLQAPNWTRDGRALIYNRNGLLYRFDLASSEVTPIDTGFATRNNNDHVLSFDGRHLGISHHAEEHDGDSIVYTVPAGGGVPRQVTQRGPSYLHGWSPDGRWLTYTGGRDDEWDIYRIRSDGSGEEIRLTTDPALDDGSEYSPDGAWIYFNSARTGTMEIWRMRPDGSGQEQVTDDPDNNWFPHVSPNGEWIVYLAYGPHVAAEDHPWYQHVDLRIRPVDGAGDTRVLAHLYGGQGTINVPSWSPDGRHVAFVSNTVFDGSQ